MAGGSSLRCMFRAHFVDKPLTLGIFQPCRLFRLVCQVAQDDEAKKKRWDGLHNEHPLPAPEAKQAVHLQQGARKWRAKNHRYRSCRHEKRNHASAVTRREPKAEIKNDAGKEAGLSNA